VSQPPTRIVPRVLKGFRDYLPQAMLVRERLMETARRVYRSYGFSPIDTPALEYLEILLGKAGEESDRQLYKFQDHGGRWVGLRFDLTVPFARFSAEHIHELGTPLKRYQIGTVWRGENPQRGRYREFVQCDFDTIGTRSLASDIETALVIYDLMCAVGFPEITLRVNSRLVLTGLLDKFGLADRSVAALRALDKLGKLGRERVLDELQAVGLNASDAERFLAATQITGSNDAVLAQLDQLLTGVPVGQQGVSQLRELVAAVEAAGVPPAVVRIDASIARGLDYYTATVYETFLNALPDIGSVCSGGRYDNLAELYTDQELPGVGASLGIDRLLAAMEKLGRVPQAATPATVLITYFDPARLHDYLRLAAQLRAAGIGVEVFPEPKKLSVQLKYADRRGFKVAIIAGSDEFASGSCQVKDLARAVQHDVPMDPDYRSIIRAITQILTETQESPIQF